MSLRLLLLRWTYRLELLLILSALLSALTGAVASGRAPEVRLHQAAASMRLESVDDSLTTSRKGHHAVPALIERRHVAAAPVLADVDVPVQSPLYMARRRE